MRVEATIRLIGDSLDPAALTRDMGRKPDVARTKGEQGLVSGRGKVLHQPTGVWLLRSPLGEDATVSQHTDWCLEQLESMPLADRSRYGIEKIDVFYGVFDGGGNSGFAMSPDQMRRFAELSVFAEFDVYPHEAAGDE